MAVVKKGMTEFVQDYMGKHETKPQEGKNSGNFQHENNPLDCNQLWFFIVHLLQIAHPSYLAACGVQSRTEGPPPTSLFLSPSCTSTTPTRRVSPA